MKSWFRKKPQDFPAETVDSEAIAAEDADSNKSAPESPDFLPSTPKRGKGVRRLNRNPLYIAGGVGFVVLIAIGYTYQSRLQQGQAQPQSAANNGGVDPVNTEALFGNVPRHGTVEQKATPAVSAPPTSPAVASSSLPSPAIENTGLSTAQSGQLPQADPFEQEMLDTKRRLLAKQLSQWEQAMIASTETGSDDFRVNTASHSVTPSSGRVPGMPDVGLPGADGLGGLAGLGGGSGNNGDQNRQAEKNAWLERSGNANDYLSNSRNAALSPYELKAGSIIPGVMVGGINSDLPGQIIGQVRENVYDSATGRHLLIPMGSRLIGSYDSQVTMGQERLLVGWNRIIYPDGSSINIQNMPGADDGGFAGLFDQVDNHYLRIYGNAFLLSIFSAGVQLSQPRGSNSGEGYNSQQIIAGALGQELGQLGMEMTRRNMNIQPTLKIRNGETFNIMVTKDMILQPWQGHK